MNLCKRKGQILQLQSSWEWLPISVCEAFELFPPTWWYSTVRIDWLDAWLNNWLINWLVDYIITNKLSALVILFILGSIILSYFIFLVVQFSLQYRTSGELRVDNSDLIKIHPELNCASSLRLCKNFGCEHANVLNNPAGWYILLKH